MLHLVSEVGSHGGWKESTFICWCRRQPSCNAGQRSGNGCHRETAPVGEHVSLSKILCKGWCGALADSLQAVHEGFRNRGSHWTIELLHWKASHSEWQCSWDLYTPPSKKLLPLAFDNSLQQWQHQLQSHIQKHGEKFAEYTGHLHVLANKAYPSWSAAQQQEVLQNQYSITHYPAVLDIYLQGMPTSLNVVIWLAVQKQCVEVSEPAA